MEYEPPTGRIAFGYDGSGVFLRGDDPETRRHATAVARLIEHASGERIEIAEDIDVALRLLDLLSSGGEQCDGGMALRPLAECLVTAPNPR